MNVLCTLVSADDESSALNVLVVGGGDLRHILTTLASTPRPVKVSLPTSKQILTKILYSFLSLKVV